MIDNIIVEKLFGYYDYNLKKINKDMDATKLMILYGDNGCGKTTLLKALFYLLSTKDKSGHKSALAKIKFHSFSVYLKNRISIQAIRKDRNLIGSFYYIIKKSNKVVYKIYLEADEETSIQLKGELNDKYKKILEYLKAFDMSIYYLTDDRKILSTIKSIFEPEEENDTDFVLAKNLRIIKEKEGYKNIVALDMAIRNSTNMIVEETLKGSNRGEQDINDIYKKIMKKLTQTSSKKISFISSKKKKNIEESLIKIKKQNRLFEKYGLITKYDIDYFIGILKKTSSRNNKDDMIINIMEPYIDGLNAKIEALQEIFDLVTLFVSNINTYYKNKQISFHINSGLKIQYPNKEELNPSMLSSGERQLLLLFCNLLTIRSKANIFLIDEPELSLNIKWQRKLLDSLLEFGRNINIQYVIASHSIEILTPHKDNVVNLTR